MPARKWDSDAVCSVEGCELLAKTKGLCQRHYDQQRWANKQAGELSRIEKQRRARQCIEPGCVRNSVAFQRCRPHYDAAKAAGLLTPEALAQQVTAFVGWLDTRAKANRVGQRVVLYRCPGCDHDHLVAWAADAEHPGLKLATCAAWIGNSSKRTWVNVAAPAHILDRPPVGYRSSRSDRATGRSVYAAMSEVDFTADSFSEQLDAAILGARGGYDDDAELPVAQHAYVA